MLRSLTFCIAILFVHLAALAQGKAPPAAEQVARAYMSAFYTGDFQTTADLADPATTAAWLVMPPREVRMPFETSMP